MFAGLITLALRGEFKEEFIRRWVKWEQQKQKPNRCVPWCITIAELTCGSASFWYHLCCNQCHWHCCVSHYYCLYLLPSLYTALSVLMMIQGNLNRCQLLTVLYVALVISSVRICCNSVIRISVLLKVLCMHKVDKFQDRLQQCSNITDHNEVTITAWSHTVWLEDSTGQAWVWLGAWWEPNCGKGVGRTSFRGCLCCSVTACSTCHCGCVKKGSRLQVQEL